MVGPGEVDDELEPEVKEECNGKYGDVISVIVFEVPNAPTPEEAVRIFIEFKRVESAIKGKLNSKVPEFQLLIHRKLVVTSLLICIFTNISSISAVIDLNGRFFGGREVKAHFFDVDKFENLVLTD